MKRLKPLIGICGLANSGKDLLAEGIAATDVYVVYHVADPIKAAINAMFGFGPAHWEDRVWKEKEISFLKKKISPRYLAQTLGTEWGRSIDSGLWLKLAKRKYEKITISAPMKQGRIMGMGMIIPDVRFENEAAWIKSEDGVMLEVIRPGLKKISESSHASEQGINSVYIDAVITNDGPPSKMIADAREKLWALSGFSAVGSAS